jgi:transcriptional regulator with XRE-family HTH domain
LLRQLRQRLDLSQEKLAERAGISARHLSFLENGRAQPSRESTLEIANALEIPPQELGVFLEAAGYAAHYANAADHYGHEPGLHDLVEKLGNPALMHDRYGTILAANSLLRALVAAVVPVSVHDESKSGHRLLEALEHRVSNWAELSAFWRRRVFLELLRAAGTDLELERLYQRWSGNAESARGGATAVVRLAVHWQESLAEFELLTATLGTPSDAGLRDFRLVLVLARNTLGMSLLDRAREALAERPAGGASSGPSNH